MGAAEEGGLAAAILAKLLIALLGLTGADDEGEGMKGCVFMSGFC